MANDPVDSLRKIMQDEYEYRLILGQRLSVLETELKNLKEGSAQRWQFWVAIGVPIIVAVALKFLKV